MIDRYDTTLVFVYYNEIDRLIDIDDLDLKLRNSVVISVLLAFE